MPMRKNESRMGMIFQKEKQMKKKAFSQAPFSAISASDRCRPYIRDIAERENRR